MHKRWTKAITIVVVFAILYVLISPIFILDPSANRAWRAALQVLLTIAMLAFVVCGDQSPSRHSDWIAFELESRGSPLQTSILCVSRC